MQIQADQICSIFTYTTTTFRVFDTRWDHLSEKQDLLANLMEGKISLQNVAPEKFQEKIFQELKGLEEQKTKEALELLGS